MLINDQVLVKSGKINPFDFSDLSITAFKGIDPVEWQKEVGGSKPRYFLDTNAVIYILA